MVEARGAIRRGIGVVGESLTEFFEKVKKKGILEPHLINHQVRTSMNAKLGLLAFLCLGIWACQSTPQAGDMEKNLQEMSKKMYNEETSRLDEEAAEAFIGACETFAKAHPQHDKAAEYLLKAGETARTMKNYPRGIALYDQVISTYPDSPKAAQALFLKGFTLDNDMKQIDQARSIYESFLEKYPNDEFADDTQFLLNNLGKSDDEIIKGFEQSQPVEAAEAPAGE